VADLNCTSIIYGIAGRSELCLGNYFSGKTACYGDSGGPAIIGDRVAGVTSRSGQVWLYGNCQLAPIIYTDVAFFRPWIKDVSGV
jgi:secreted trypsin-like serine protease